MKTTLVLFVFLQCLLFLIQLLTLTTTYWTTWELKFNWTQTVGRFTAKPSSDGQLVSRGHSGLWSRCVTVYGTGKHINGTRLTVDRCFSNFDGFSSFNSYSYGKTCKTATAGLCVALASITAVILIISLTATSKRNHILLSSFHLLLMAIQGAISVAIPLLYISGNMAELVHQLTTAYGLLLVVHIQALYYHGWSFWLQVSLSFAWITAMAIYVIKEEKSDRKWRASSTPTSSSKNGRTVEQIDSESETLRGT